MRNIQAIRHMNGDEHLSYQSIRVDEDCTAVVKPVTEEQFEKIKKMGMEERKKLIDDILSYKNLHL